MPLQDERYWEDSGDFLSRIHVPYFDLFQQKALSDFLWSMAESDEMSFAKAEDKLSRFKLSQQDEMDCQLMNAVQKLLRIVSTNYTYNYETLSATLP